VFVSLLTAAVYANAFRAGFTFDDEFQIRTNPAVMNGVDMIGILASPLYDGTVYRPLTTFTFAVQQALWPDQPTPCHALNVILHVAVTLLVGAVAQELTRKRSAGLLAALVFGLHPVHTEAVTSLVGRAEELAALGALGAMWSYARAGRAHGRIARMAWYTSSVASFALGLLSKESALTILPLLLALPVALDNEPLFRALGKVFRQATWLPYIACAAAFLWMRSAALSTITPEPVFPLNNILSIVPASIRIISALGVWFDGISQLLAPIVLSADYSHAQVPVLTSWFAPRSLAGAVLLIGPLVAAVFASRRVALLLVFPVVTSMVTANLLFAIGTIRGERLMYLPSAGWAMLFGLLLQRIGEHPRNRRIAAAVAGVWLCLLGVRTWVRNEDWRNDFTLHASTVRTSPLSSKAHYNYAIALKQSGDSAGALRHMLRSLELYPWAYGASNGIGRLFEPVDPQRAEGWFERTIRIEPSYLEGYANLCRIRLEMARYEEAIRACRAGLRHDPTHVEMLKGLAAGLLGRGDQRAGLWVLRLALALRPGEESLRQAVTALEAQVSSPRGGAS